MLTVQVIGNREGPPSWIEIVAAWADPSRAVLPIDEVYPEGVTVEQTTEQSRVEMLNSQRQAVAAALNELGYEFPSSLTVVEAMEGGASDGILESGDIIRTLNGESFEDVVELRAAIGRNGVDRPAEVVVQRNGAVETLRVTPALSSEEVPTPVLGILVGNDYEFPFEVRIQLENVGGPSAGMMFALGIIDKLTPGAINGGERVAGTGTITATGDIGPIGGIRQKMFGALGAGNQWFLAPQSNCDEVVDNVPQGLTVYAVETLDDALAALDAIDTGVGRDALPTCSVG